MEHAVVLTKMSVREPTNEFSADVVARRGRWAKTRVEGEAVGEVGVLCVVLNK